MRGACGHARKYMHPGPISRAQHRSCALPDPGIMHEHTENGSMSDVILLAIGLGFFALLVLYGIASEKL